MSHQAWFDLEKHVAYIPFKIFLVKVTSSKVGKERGENFLVVQDGKTLHCII